MARPALHENFQRSVQKFKGSHCIGAQPSHGRFSFLPLTLSSLAACTIVPSHEREGNQWAIRSLVIISTPVYFLGLKEDDHGMDKTTQWPTEKTPTKERRKTTRYLIPAPIWFQWQTADGHWEHAIGITRDIGIDGLFVESESVLPVDCTIKLIVTLPARPKFDTTFELKGTAYVRHVRREQCQTGGFGVLAVFHPNIPMATVVARGKQWRC